MSEQRGSIRYDGANFTAQRPTCDYDLISNVLIEGFEIDETLNTLSQAGGETLTAAKYLELQTNLTALKLSYRLRSNTLDATIRVDSMTIWGRAWYKVGVT